MFWISRETCSQDETDATLLPFEIDGTDGYLLHPGDLYQFLSDIGAQVSNHFFTDANGVLGLSLSHHASPDRPEDIYNFRQIDRAVASEHRVDVEELHNNSHVDAGGQSPNVIDATTEEEEEEDGEQPSDPVEDNSSSTIPGNSGISADDLDFDITSRAQHVLRGEDDDIRLYLQDFTGVQDDEQRETLKETTRFVLQNTDSMVQAIEQIVSVQNIAFDRPSLLVGPEAQYDQSHESQTGKQLRIRLFDPPREDNSQLHGEAPGNFTDQAYRPRSAGQDRVIIRSVHSDIYPFSTDGNRMDGAYDSFRPLAEIERVDDGYDIYILSTRAGITSIMENILGMCAKFLESDTATAAFDADKPVFHLSDWREVQLDVHTDTVDIDIEDRYSNVSDRVRTMYSNAQTTATNLRQQYDRAKSNLVHQDSYESFSEHVRGCLEQIRGHQKIKMARYNPIDKKLSVHTKELLVYDDREDVFHQLGEYRIQMDIRKTKPKYGVRFYNLDRLVDGHWDQTHAPHVYPSGKPCEGNFHAMYKGLMENNQFGTAMSQAVKFLESVNTDDPAGDYVHNWPAATSEVIDRYQDNCGALPYP